MAPKDFFSTQSREYARYRPRYPSELIDYVSALPQRRERASDCATGSGQTADALAGRFSAVVATDLSLAQITWARRNREVRYAVGLAEGVPLEADSVDLVVVSQALHWLIFDPFYAEVRRVPRSGGAFAAWCYYGAEISPPIDELLREYDEEIVRPYWAPELRYVADRCGRRSHCHDRTAPVRALGRVVAPQKRPLAGCPVGCSSSIACC